MPVSTVWISYDLGIRGDYEGLYGWLDSHQAKECGDSLAVLSYKHTGDIPAAIKKELGHVVGTNRRTRIYVIYKDRKTGKNKGRFVFGGRRAAPWSGYASDESETADDEA